MPCELFNFNHACDRMRIAMYWRSRFLEVFDLSPLTFGQNKEALIRVHTTGHSSISIGSTSEFIRGSSFYPSTIGIAFSDSTFQATM